MFKEKGMLHTTVKAAKFQKKFSISSHLHTDEQNYSVHKLISSVKKLMDNFFFENRTKLKTFFLRFSNLYFNTFFIKILPCNRYHIKASDNTHQTVEISPINTFPSNLNPKFNHFDSVLLFLFLTN